MGWLRRLRGEGPPPAAPPEKHGPEVVEGAAPGIAALLEGVGEHRIHSVLDLGSATEASLAIYGRFARRIRFADVLADAAAHEGAAATLRSVPAQPGDPYDILFTWDLLDRVFPEERDQVVARLVELSSPRARMHALIRSSSDAPSAPLRFGLVGIGRMRYEVTGAPRSTRPPLLPAEVETLLHPFRVVRGFTLKGGLREYVAVRSPDPSGSDLT